jgi:hypothetical protein
MTLNQLERADVNDPIFVVNKAPPVGGMRSRLIIPVPKSGMTNTQDTLNIPPTWIPIELTGQTTRDSILSSSEFRKLVTKEYVLVLTPEYARKMLRSDEAQEELRRLKQEDLMVDAVAMEHSIGMANPSGSESNEGQQIKPAIILLMDDPDSNSELTVLNSLKSVVNKTEADLEYIVAKATAHKMQRVKTKYQETLNKRRAKAREREQGSVDED